MLLPALPRRYAQKHDYDDKTPTLAESVRSGFMMILYSYICVTSAQEATQRRRALQARARCRPHRRYLRDYDDTPSAYDAAFEAHACQALRALLIANSISHAPEIPRRLVLPMAYAL